MVEPPIRPALIELTWRSLSSIPCSNPQPPIDWGMFFRLPGKEGLRNTRNSCSKRSMLPQRTKVMNTSLVEFLLILARELQPVIAAGLISVTYG